MQEAPDSVQAGVELREALAGALANVTGWVEGFIERLPAIIAALLVLLAFLVLARLARHLASRLLGRMSARGDLTRVIAGATWAAVMAAGLLVALGIVGLDKTVTSLLAGAGILVLALGLAFQETAQNLIAGLILNVRKEFSSGDIVRTKDFMGVVEQVEIRATMIRTFEGQLVVVPNHDVISNPLVNYSDLGVRRIDLAIGVSYGDDLEKARAIALGTVEGIETHERSRPIEAFYTGFGGSSIDLEVRFWVAYRREADFLSARSEAIIRIKGAFDREKISIPFPIRTLDFSPVGGVELHDAWPRGPEPGTRRMRARE